MKRAAPAVVVVSTLFPSASKPLAGVFIKERMRRVAEQLPVTVISPQPWFPLQSVVRRWRPTYRPALPARELIDGLEVLRPRFLAVPGLFRRLDASMMARAIERAARPLMRSGRADVLDAHFLYPDGCAAALAGQRLRLPVSVTLRGTEPGHAERPALRRAMQRALLRIDAVFAVSASLRRLALELGASADRARVVGNGVDLAMFHPIDRNDARRALSLPPDALVLVSVGGLVERKGFHRVIDCLPALIARAGARPVRYLVVGGPSPEGDMSDALRRQVAALKLTEVVHFLGPLPPAQLKGPLSASDVFVLATRNEGWANVFLEAMACGLPVVTTQVGGNAEVVCRDDLGLVVPFGDSEALLRALVTASERVWDREAIRAYACDNTWDRRVAALVAAFRAMVDERRAAGRPVAADQVVDA